jgi:CheY-like chemotaxis protein
VSEPKELDIVIADEVAAEMADDPEMAKAMRELFAAFHQAHHAVATGQYASFDDAMEAITGSRPEPVFLDDEDDEP